MLFEYLMLAENIPAASLVRLGLHERNTRASPRDRVWSCRAGLKRPYLAEIAVRAAELMAKYISEVDILNNLIDNCCTRRVDLKCTLKEFYDVFSSQYENRRIQQKTLSKRLKDAGFKVDKGTAGKHYVYGFCVDDHTNTMNLLK